MTLNSLHIFTLHGKHECQYDPDTMTEQGFHDEIVQEFPEVSWSSVEATHRDNKYVYDTSLYTDVDDADMNWQMYIESKYGL